MQVWQMPSVIVRATVVYEWRIDDEGDPTMPAWLIEKLHNDYTLGLLGDLSHDKFHGTPASVKFSLVEDEVTCTNCNDTHMVELDGEGRQVMCTRCPVPCDYCRKNGRGAYCTEVKCSCACHQTSGKSPARV